MTQTPARGPRPSLMDTLVFDGQPLKHLGTEVIDGVETARFGGYLVVFSDPSTPDLTGDFFTKSTDFGVLSDVGETVLPAYYHHGLDETLGRRRIGHAKARIDDAGVWAEYQVQLRDDYTRELASLVTKGALGQSSGAVGHLVERGEDGHLKMWVLGEASLTPTPAEPRTSAVPLKSLQEASPSTDSTALADSLRSLNDSFEAPPVDLARVLRTINRQFSTT